LTRISTTTTELLTVEQAAKQIGVHPATVRRWATEGLPVLRAGARGNVRIDPDELRGFLERGRDQ
jgi:excisionase family DNA binding protein